MVQDSIRAFDVFSKFLFPDMRPNELKIVVPQMLLLELAISLPGSGPY